MFPDCSDDDEARSIILFDAREKSCKQIGALGN